MTAEQALELAAETAFDVVVMDEIFSPEPGALRGSAAIARLRGLSDGDEGGGGRRRPVLIHCTGQTDASGDGGACSLGGHRLGLAAGADALWGKPMPSFTNGEMQRIVADLLSSRQKIAAAGLYTPLRGEEQECDSDGSPP